MSSVKKDKLIITVYKEDGEYYAMDKAMRIWAGPAETKTILRYQISNFNKKNLNVPKLVLK